MENEDPIQDRTEKGKLSQKRPESHEKVTIILSPASSIAEIALPSML